MSEIPQSEISMLLERNAKLETCVVDLKRKIAKLEEGKSPVQDADYLYKQLQECRKDLEGERERASRLNGKAYAASIDTKILGIIRSLVDVEL